MVRVPLLLLAALCAFPACCRIPRGQSGANVKVACGFQDRVTFPGPVKCFQVKVKRRSTCRLEVKLWCKGDQAPTVNEILKAGDKKCWCCPEGNPGYVRLQLRCLPDDPRGFCAYCATTRDKCP